MKRGRAVRAGDDVGPSSARRSPESNGRASRSHRVRTPRATRVCTARPAVQRARTTSVMYATCPPVPSRYCRVWRNGTYISSSGGATQSARTAFFTTPTTVDHVGSSGLGFDRDPLADRILVRPVAPRHELVHEHHRRRADPIGFGDVPTAKNGQSAWSGSSPEIRRDRRRRAFPPGAGAAGLRRGTGTPRCRPQSGR